MRTEKDFNNVIVGSTSRDRKLLMMIWGRLLCDVAIMTIYPSSQSMIIELFWCFAHHEKLHVIIMVCVCAELMPSGWKIHDLVLFLLSCAVFVCDDRYDWCFCVGLVCLILSLLSFARGLFSSDSDHHM